MIWVIPLALMLDGLLGDPRRWHPVAGFGYLAGRLEQACYRPGLSASTLLVRGAAACLLLLCPPVLCLWWVTLGASPMSVALIDVVVLYFCIGNRSLAQHARAVEIPLTVDDLPGARGALALLVSRDTETLAAAGLVRGSVESVLENGHDAVLAPLCWYLIGGAPAVLLHRLANTLDAMWGYRSDRYRYFGRMAARVDDVLGWLPARACALLYALTGKLWPALRCWRRQGGRTASPNAGVVMAAGAGALGIWIGGPAVYGGQIRPRPVLGSGREARPDDISRALHLLWRAIAVFVLIACFWQWGWERVG